jgi:hypothetical protein
VEFVVELPQPDRTAIRRRLKARYSGRE